MLPVNIISDNINVIFPRNKKYNPSVAWADLTIYFRFRGKLLKRCPTVLTKKRVLQDYKELLELFDKEEWTEDERNDETDWHLCFFKDVKSLKANKKPVFRHLYDDPESNDIHEDLFILEKKNDFGYKPYMTEIIVSDKDLTEDVLRDCAKAYLKNCFNVSVKKSEIHFMKNVSPLALEIQWEEFKERKDREIEAKKSGKKEKIVFIKEAAKQMFGDDVKKVTIEGNKTIKEYEDGEIEVLVSPNLKFVKKKKKKKQ
jgi:hypothetical protein